MPNLAISRTTISITIVQANSGQLIWRAPKAASCVKSTSTAGCDAQLQGLTISQHEVSLCVQRMHEERRALFSCFYWAVFAWNREQLAAAGRPPDASFWTALVVPSYFHIPLPCA